MVRHVAGGSCWCRVGVKHPAEHPAEGSITDPASQPPFFRTSHRSRPHPSPQSPLPRGMSAMIRKIVRKGAYLGGLGDWPPGTRRVGFKTPEVWVIPLKSFATFTIPSNPSQPESSTSHLALPLSFSICRQPCLHQAVGLFKVSNVVYPSPLVPPVGAHLSR